MKNTAVFVLILFVLSCCTPKEKQGNETEKNLVSEMKHVLDSLMIDVWYPRVIDATNGGYFSDFTYDWELGEPQNKFIVTQARHVWATSFLYENYEEKEEYLRYAGHGFHFLRDHMWDKEFGGFYDLTDSTGNLLPRSIGADKRAYGNSFAIYALAQYYKVSKNEEALELAKKTFLWLEENSHDPVNGGYFQILDRTGKPIVREEAAKYAGYENFQVGLKDYNSSIHLLEAFTTLYQVWPDELVRQRLQEMYDIVSGVMLDDRGFLKLYFHPDWTQVTDEELHGFSREGNSPTNHITFGHDVETAFLLYEAAGALHIIDNELFQKMKKMVDHAIQHGWDKKYGGLFDGGKYVDGEVAIINDHKQWWAQAEALNAFLLMHRIFPDDTIYMQKFEEQWAYVNEYLIDHEHGGWYIYGLDVGHQFSESNKVSIWKGSYHTVRAMVHCLEMLGEGRE